MSDEVGEFENDDRDGSNDKDADRGDGFVSTDPDADVSQEDLDEEAENAEALRVKAAADKAKEAAENEKVAKGDKPTIGDKTTPDPKDKADEKKDDDKKDEEKKPEPRIPLSRHKQLLDAERARRAESESALQAALKAGNREQVTADTAADEKKLEELDEKYNKQLADGEIKEATATMKAIRALDRAIGNRQRDAEIAAVEERAIERGNFTSAVAKLEAAYPVIDPDSTSYDAAKVAEVLEMKAAWEKTGLTPTLALQKAVGYVLKPVTAAQAEATDEDAGKDDEKDAKGDTAAERKAAAVAKAVKDAAKQPANSSKTGIDSDKAGGGVTDAAAVMKMSMKDFDKLGEEELSRMRGDTL